MAGKFIVKKGEKMGTVIEEMDDVEVEKLLNSGYYKDLGFASREEKINWIKCSIGGDRLSKEIAAIYMEALREAYPNLIFD